MVASILIYRKQKNKRNTERDFLSLAILCTFFISGGPCQWRSCHTCYVICREAAQGVEYSHFMFWSLFMSAYSCICCVGLTGCNYRLTYSSSLGCKQINQIDHIFVVKTCLPGLKPPPPENLSLTSPDISLFYWVTAWVASVFEVSDRADELCYSLFYHSLFLWALGAEESSLPKECRSCWRGMMHQHMWKHMHPQGRRTWVERIYASVPLSHVLQALRLFQLHLVQLRHTSADIHIFSKIV